MVVNRTVTPTHPEPEVREAEGAAPEPDRLAVTAGKFAELVGVHHNTVSLWLKDGLPATRVGGGGRGSRAMVDIATGFQWVRARDAKELADVKAAADPEGAKAAKLTAEARLKEIDLAEREAKLVHADDVVSTWSQAMVAIRESVMGVAGNAVQSGIIEAAQEAELEELCRESLTALGRKFQEEGE